MIFYILIIYNIIAHRDTFAPDTEDMMLWIARAEICIEFVFSLYMLAHLGHH
jgi:hypothetical protein